ncbi:MAG: hypothetical protein JWL84_217 [Rhodospirillales bacterium]|jgi:hypothetical protein|nr:hypothetical protein [Rhodospirillales bacterium]
MTRPMSLPVLLASAFVAVTAAAPAHADSAYDPSRAWIEHVANPASPPAESSSIVVKRDPAQEFVGRLANPAAPPAESSSIVVKRDPAQEFVARLSAAHS